jgi:sugar lactone lactonase YvrE
MAKEWSHCGWRKWIRQWNQSTLQPTEFDDQTVYVADWSNHRIVEWKSGATSGRVVAGGNRHGSGAHQLSNPYDVIVDKERDSLIICDRSNQRLVRWPRRNGTSGETIISNISCRGLTMDENGSLYVTNDVGNHEVRRYRRGESEATVVAGGNGSGNRLDQLSYPTYVFVDGDHSVYVSDWGNHRVMKWVEGAKEGIVVAGGRGQGNGLTQLSNPLGVVFDQLGTVYVADWGNVRIMRWNKGATQGSVIVGGNGEGGVKW